MFTPKCRPCLFVRYTSRHSEWIKITLYHTVGVFACGWLWLCLWLAWQLSNANQRANQRLLGVWWAERGAFGPDFPETYPMFRLLGHPTNAGHQRWIELEATPTLVTIESFHTWVSHKLTNLNSTCVRCSHWNTMSTNKHSLVKHIFSHSSAHPENTVRIGFSESQLIHHVHVEATTTTTTRKRTPPVSEGFMGESFSVGFESWWYGGKLPFHLST